ncbi:MAG TPA: hypothetical protein VMJ34_09220 [Bryobacteraceae bacterium]|nr:hypothetical protein [Bryobacteraceae bacterium]
MPILLVVTLVPTLSFYFYVLVQFAREANRRRRRHTRALVLPLQKEAYDALEMDDGEPRVAEIAIASRIARPAAALAPEAAPAEDKVVPTYLKSRFAVYASQTGRLAPRRAAKG